MTPSTPTTAAGNAMRPDPDRVIRLLLDRLSWHRGDHGADHRDDFDALKAAQEYLEHRAALSPGNATPSPSLTPELDAIQAGLNARSTPAPATKAPRGLREILDDIERAADHQIPFYAYGDNEAGCALARALEQVRNLVGQAAALAPYVTAQPAPSPAREEGAELLGKAFAGFRQDLRQLLFENNVPASMGWTESDIVQAFRELLADRATLRTLASELAAALELTNKFLIEEVYREQGGHDSPPEPADSLSHNAIGHYNANVAVIHKFRSSTPAPAPAPDKPAHP